jgi:hypothetical protein
MIWGGAWLSSNLFILLLHEGILLLACKLQSCYRRFEFATFAADLIFSMRLRRPETASQLLF